MKQILHIRPTSLPLAPMLAKLHAESFSEEAWPIEQVRSSLRLETTQGWVAFEEAKPAGFILCQVLSEQIEILTFCVRPTMRRRLIGRRLLQSVIAHARENGQKIFLEVAADNEAARKLYDQLGFEITGTRPNYYRRGAITIDALMFTYKRP